MVKTLTLTNEQAIVLYNLLSSQELNRVENRQRWKFLEIIEETVFDYEKSIRELKDQAQLFNDEKDLSAKDKIARMGELDEKLKKLQKVVNHFDFNDREVFAKVKDIFEKAGEKIEGHTSKIYFQIEDAFIDVKESKSDEKPSKKK